MAKNSPLDVSAWIRRLGLDFKDSITPYGLSCIFPYHQIRVDESLLRAAANYWVPSTKQNYALLLRNLLLSWVNRRLMTSSSFPWVGIFLPYYEFCWMSLLPQQIGGASLGSSTLSQFLSIFSVQPFSRVRGHAHTLFLPFAYVLLQGISWFKTCIVWTFGCA